MTRLSATETTCQPSFGQLFMGFFKVGISGFGGVLPHARRVLVDDRHWLTDPQFTELLSLGQTLPGPNVLNMAVVIGARCHGWLGSVLAALGLMAAPVVIVLTLGSLADHFAHSARLANLLAGVAAGAAGLVLATGGRLAVKLERHTWSTGVLIAAFLAVFWLRLPLLGILAILGPVSVAFGWYSLRQERLARTGGASL